jgi:hypothetical protein
MDILYGNQNQPPFPPQYGNQMMNGMPQQPQMAPQQQYVDPRRFDTPEITLTAPDGSSGIKFSIVGDNNPSSKPLAVIDNTLPEERKRRGRPPKNKSSEIIRPGDSEKVSGVVESDAPTAYTYMETTDMLRETLTQIDSLNGELVKEFSNVKANKYIKNKYNTIIGLSENIGSLLNTKISAIREINSSISKSNDLDYKKAKDMKALQAEVNDDQYVANMYKSFISNPQVQQIQPQFTPIDQTIVGGGIVRANINSGDVTKGGPIDASYMQYMANLSPEENMMLYENNPNVKQVVVFDASSGGKYFEIMDTSTGQVIPNMPKYDQMFMEDVTIDVKNKIAKNNNLHETFPLVIINENSSLQY